MGQDAVGDGGQFSAKDESSPKSRSKFESVSRPTLNSTHDRSSDTTLLAEISVTSFLAVPTIGDLAAEKVSPFLLHHLAWVSLLCCTNEISRQLADKTRSLSSYDKQLQMISSESFRL
jgi:hypothetical protein